MKTAALRVEDRRASAAARAARLKMLRHCTALMLFLGLSFSAGQPALAWSEDGNRAVADIATRRLTRSAMHEVKILLAIEHRKSLADIANSANQLRSTHPATRPWYYVDIPLTEDSYDASRDCVQGACLIAKIAEFRAVLGNKSKPKAARLEALEYLVGLVSDLHQPLRCSNNGDRGGRDVKVAGYLGSKDLNAVWDEGIIKASALTSPDTGQKLNGKISAAHAKDWSRGSVIQWANESHGVARNFIYTHLPDSSGNLPPNYQKESEPIVALQLQKAGVRLAAVLNATLK